MTNYERIKAMSIEEMTDMLTGYVDMSECCYEKFAMCCKDGECQGKDGACRPAISRWLGQEETVEQL